MSDIEDKPANPFGRAERTIIRTRNPARKDCRNPRPTGLRHKRAEQQPARAPRSRPIRWPDNLAATIIRRQRPSTSPSPGPSRPWSPHPGRLVRAGALDAAPASEEWISSQNQPAPRADLPTAPPLRVDDLVAPAANPIMRAAGPLLQLLGRLRVALLRASFASLMEQVADAVKFFEKDIRSAGISEQQANTAKYILCATADDIVQHIPTDERHVWAQYSMLSRFFGERVGGVRFFEILDRLKADPLVNYPVLELQHACLALGFQGMHRASAGGLPALQQIQRNLYELLRQVRPRMMRDLSPHWRGQALRRPPPADFDPGLAGGIGRRRIAVCGIHHLADMAR